MDVRKAAEAARDYLVSIVAELGNVEQHIIRALRVGVRDVQLVQTLEEQLLFMGQGIVQIHISFLHLL